MGPFDSVDIIFMIFAVYFIYTGIRQIVQKNENFFLKKTDRYTKESMEKTRVPMGVCMILFGIGWLLSFVFKGLGNETLHSVLRWASLAFLVVVVILFFTLKVDPEKKR